MTRRTGPEIQYGTGRVQNPTAPAPTFTGALPRQTARQRVVHGNDSRNQLCSGGSLNVTIGGVAATNVVVADSTHITATTPQEPDSKCINHQNDGQTVTATGAYTYMPAPTVTGITPASSVAGTRWEPLTPRELYCGHGTRPSGWQKREQTDITATNVTVVSPNPDPPARSRFPRPLPHRPGSGISS